MPESILVVEYEPRYADRVRQALAGQPFAPSFAKDGEEALRVIAAEHPALIVLSSVVPKVSAPELIRAIRNDARLQATPILLTVSGYSGDAPKADAQRYGVSDILPKPYSETEFLGKVQQMLGLNGVHTAAASPGALVHPTPASAQHGVTSTELFGDLTDDAAARAAKRSAKASEEVDKMLAQTLAGVMPQKKKDSAPPTKPAAAPARPHTQSGNVALDQLDKLREDTLSGLEKTLRTRPPGAAQPAPSQPSPAAVPAPQPAPRPVTAPAPPPPQQPPAVSVKAAAAGNAGEEIPTVISKQAVVLPSPPPVVAEEEEPTDGIRFGQYVLLDKIATGGMAEVWRARMRGVEGFQKIVAIKKILPHLSENREFVEMFVDEAKLAAQLSHTNIVHIFDLGKIQNSYFIAMEYVDGFDLKTILRRAEERDHPMQVELALFVTSKIAAALDYAHRRRDFENRDLGLVHRDVSPQNVLISEEGDIKLCDFGIAKAASKASHTQAGALKGKLQYMSPEQAWGHNIDRRSDIFSLGTVLFEMLTRRKLFSGENELSVLDQVREARVTAPSLFNDEVTPAVDAIVIKSLQKDPDRRYQTAAEMARDIDQILYSFKPTPTSADLAIYMHRLSAPDRASLQDEAASEPEPVHAAPPPAPPVAAPAPVVTAPPIAAAPAAHASPTVAAPAREEKKKTSAAVPAIAAVVVIAAVAGGWFFTHRGNTASALSPAAARAPRAAATTTTAPTASALPAASAALPVTASTSTVPVIDPAKVDAEVRKRLDAERQKLEQGQKPNAPATRTAPQAAPVVATQAAAPPVTQTEAPAAPPRPQPAAPAPQPVAETHAPAAAPPQSTPDTPRAHEGDLVSPGTEGLTAAHITRQAVPLYPPLARAQRVEGTVILNVLVSEAGQVLDVKILSGVNRPVGINEAAMQAARHSSFAAGMKDGVRVKSWTAIKVDFKL